MSETNSASQLIDESQLVGVPVVMAADGQDLLASASALALPLSDSAGVKRKRGRPPKGGQAKAPPDKRMKTKDNDEEEDVCFICFDGGSLVLCDRRGCPKAYHVTCIKRDEDFFQSKAKWNCGWHICSKCAKISSYMCYTCTFSLCKGCTKDADYVSVRGDKGFCSMCFKTIMLIENKDPGNKDVPQVDFDDKTSWEYLFKIYWVVLKQKLSLTLPELMQAKPPPLKGTAVTTSYKVQPARARNVYNNGKIPIPNVPSEFVETKTPKEIENKELIKIQNGELPTTEKRATDKGTSSLGSTKVRRAKSNVDEYAAVDIHNISLIYLRRDLMLYLFEDNNEKFHAKVMGSIVRIRIPSSDQKQDLHRLVKVVGTNKVAVPYNVGNKSFDVALVVLNLGKQEDVLIDAISNNHDFSEEECKDLRQSMKRGLVELWTVGEIRDKAMSLQAAKFKDWVETEILRFNQLRDQASEQGQTKELRDCVERLQLLKSPEERRRRLREAPEIHSDQKMDPYYYGPDDDDADCNINKNQDKKEVSPEAERVKEGKDTSQSNNTSERQENESGTAGLSSSLNDQATTLGPIPTTTSETSTTPLSTESTPPANESEAEKVWHYIDLKGQTQGPFSMLQLQKWSATGYFPPDMRIWASSQDDSVLLSDALDGQLLYNISVQFKEVGGESINANRRDNAKTKELSSNNLKDSKNHSSTNGEAVIPSRGMVTTSNKQEEPLKADSNTCLQKQTPVPSSVAPSMPLGGGHAVVSQTEKPQEMESKLESDLNQENWNSRGLSTSSAEVHVAVPVKPQEMGTRLELDLDQLNWNSHGTTTTTTIATTVAETSSVNENQSNSKSVPSQSSSQSWRPLPLNFFPNNFESSEGNTGVDIPDLHSPAPKTSSGGWESRRVENNHSVSVTATIPVREPVTVDLPILTLKMSNEDQNEQEAENIQSKQQSLPMNFPVQDSGPSWAHNTGLEPDKWGGYFSNTMKPSVEEWDSGSVMLKPHEALADSHVSLSSRIDQLFQSPRSNPTSSWQMGFTERIEFSTLAEESVSDLLAEVDAMENQGGLPSPTSVMKSGEDLIHGPKHDYFGNMEEEFSPTLDPVNPVKTETMSLTGDIYLPSHSIRGEPVASYFDPIKGVSTSALSSTRADVYRDSKPIHFPSRSGLDMSDMESRKSRTPKSKSTRWDPVQLAKGQEETKSNLDPNPNPNPNGQYLQFPLLNMDQDVVDSVNSPRSRTESMDTDWLKMHQSPEKVKTDGRCSDRVSSPLNISRRSGPQEQIDSGWDPLHGNLNQGYQGMSRGSGSIDHGESPGSRGRESRKHGDDRLTSPRDRVSSHSRESGRDSRGSKSSWSRQSSGGGGNGSYSSSRHPARGQRVCKFFESGHCKKGALCEYFHP